MARRKKTLEEQVKDGLSKLAFGDISDAVALLFLSEEEIIHRLPKLNLFNISELKRPKTGGMEIKFFDRIKACEKLRDITAVKSDEGLGFFEALEKSTKNIKGNNLND